MSVAVRMSPLNAEAWHTTLSQTDGRDKIIRLLQFVSKLLRGFDAGRTSPKSGTMAWKAAKLETALSSSRQITRLFKWASVYANAKSRLFAFSPSSTTVIEALAMLTDVSLFSYYAYDNAAFASKVGMLTSSAPRAFQRRGARFWFLALVAGVAANLLRLHTLHIRAVNALQARRRSSSERKEDESDDAGGDRVSPVTSESDEDTATATATALVDSQRECREAAHRQNAIIVSLIRQLADAVIAGSAGWNFDTHPAFVGACGSISSAIGLVQLWPRQ